ncbi:hypothetical protein D0859_06535 [Hortaea werneckii]|uniref:Secreted protein n=1 Tax=Hortaea werneckii TaxID=91943 RepID=A0A3M7IUW3_HORWE|nr:hypothetical protein D0859_06535 [Hortaea werneckii]
MKFPLLAGICLVSARTIDEVQCQKKNGDLTTMIHQFCNNRKIVVPGWYAEQGQWTPNSHSKIFIEGNCKPPQWIPPYWCKKQFFSMCARGGGHGGSKAKFGKDKCQKWEIYYDRHPGWHQ